MKLGCRRKGQKVCLAKCLNSVLNVKALVASRHFQPGEGLLCDYEPSNGPSFEALLYRHIPLSYDCAD